jgi:uncharacterized repeat protein (TIGR01451 family)
VQSPGLSLDKTVNPTKVTEAGRQVTYSYVVKNTGNVDLTDVGVSETSFTGTGTAPSPSCPATSLAPGTQTTCTAAYTVTQADMNAGTVTNTATAGGKSPGGSNVSSSPATAVLDTEPISDLSIAKTASPSTAVPGTNETYSLKIKNAGPSPSRETVASDELPAELSFVSAGNGCGFAAGKVTCDAGTLAPGAEATFTIVTKVAGSATHRIDNTAKVTSTSRDPDPTDNHSTAETPIGPKADLHLTKEASVKSVRAGGQVMYTLVVTDEGPSDATGVIVSDPAPAGLHPVSATSSQGKCSVDASGVTCKLGGIVAGGTAQVLVTADTADDASGQVVNTATVVGDQPDPESKDDTASSTITVKQPPQTGPPTKSGTPQAQQTTDLRIVKHVDHADATVGSRLVYTLVVTNAGGNAASDVDVTDTPSIPLAITKVSTTQGSCEKGAPLKCALGNLAAGAKATITVVGTPEREGVEENSASAVSAARDSNASNNLSRVKAAVSGALGLGKTGPASVRAGHKLTYHLRVSNRSIVAMQDVRVCDSLPAGLVFVRATPKAKLADGRYCWSIATLKGHAHRTLALVAKALSGAEGLLTNSAKADARGIPTVAATHNVRVIAKPTRKGGVTG